MTSLYSESDLSPRHFLHNRPRLLEVLKESQPLLNSTIRRCVRNERGVDFSTLPQLSDIAALLEFFTIVPESTWVKCYSTYQGLSTVFLGLMDALEGKGAAFSISRINTSTAIDMYAVTLDGKRDIASRGRGITLEKVWRDDPENGKAAQVDANCLAFVNGERLQSPLKETRFPVKQYDALRNTLRRTYRSLVPAGERQSSLRNTPLLSYSYQK